MHAKNRYRPYAKDAFNLGWRIEKATEIIKKSFLRGSATARGFREKNYKNIKAA